MENLPAQIIMASIRDKKFLFQLREGFEQILA